MTAVFRTLHERAVPAECLREDDHFDGALVILEREHAHRIALLRLQAAETGHDAADVNVLDDQPPRRTVGALRDFGHRQIADGLGAEGAEILGMAIDRMAAQI